MDNQFGRTHKVLLKTVGGTRTTRTRKCPRSTGGSGGTSIKHVVSSTTTPGVTTTTTTTTTGISQRTSKQRLRVLNTQQQCAYNDSDYISAKKSRNKGLNRCVSLLNRILDDEPISPVKKEKGREISSPLFQSQNVSLAKGKLTVHIPTVTEQRDLIDTPIGDAPSTHTDAGPCNPALHPPISTPHLPNSFPLPCNLTDQSLPMFNNRLISSTPDRVAPRSRLDLSERQKYIPWTIIGSNLCSSEPGSKPSLPEVRSQVTESTSNEITPVFNEGGYSMYSTLITDTSQTGPTQSRPIEIGPTQTEPTQTTPSHMIPTQTRPTQATPSHMIPTQTRPTQATPSLTGPIEIGLSQTGSSHMIPTQAEPSQIGHSQPKSTQTIPFTSQGPTQIGPPQIGPTQEVGEESSTEEDAVSWESVEIITDIVCNTGRTHTPLLLTTGYNEREIPVDRSLALLPLHSDLQRKVHTLGSQLRGIEKAGHRETADKLLEYEEAISKLEACLTHDQTLIDTLRLQNKDLEWRLQLQVEENSKLLETLNNKEIFHFSQQQYWQRETDDMRTELMSQVKSLQHQLEESERDKRNIKQQQLQLNVETHRQGRREVHLQTEGGSSAAKGHPAMSTATNRNQANELSSQSDSSPSDREDTGVSSVPKLLLGKPLRGGGVRSCVTESTLNTVTSQDDREFRNALSKLDRDISKLQTSLQHCQSE